MPFFTRDWLQQIQQAQPDFNVQRSATNNPGLPTFKTYLSDHYKIPSITVELGDDTAVESIEKFGKTAATAMMNILVKK